MYTLLELRNVHALLLLMHTLLELRDVHALLLLMHTLLRTMVHNIYI